MYSIQIDANLAEEAQSVLQDMGSDITTAVTAFLRQTVRERDAEERRLAEIHKRGMEEIKSGKGILVSMETLEKMADE